MLDVNRLRVIEVVARHGSVTKAAKELHYSQPSVTHHLTRLEAETGAGCCSGLAAASAVTPAGQLLADRAAEIIGRIDAADAELSAHVGPDRRAVRLAGFASALATSCPGAWRRWQKRYPGLEVGLTDTHPQERSSPPRRQGRDRDDLPLRRDRGGTARRPPAPPARRPGVPAVDGGRRRAPRPLHDATWIAGCERCRTHLLYGVRPRRASNPGSATPPTTWS